MTLATPGNNPQAMEPAKVRRDFRQEATDQIVQMLEKGVAPWQKPWEAGTLGMPFNPTTNNAYRGGNAIHLMATALLKGYDDPRWLTYKQAVQNGWQVREGEKGTQIEYWQYPSREPAAKENTNNATDKNRDREQRPVHRVYTIFNAQQIDGIPAYQRKVRPQWEVISTGEHILENSGASIMHDRNDQALYDRLNDRIHLPPKSAFEKAADYYGTALHELGHWTGHPERLDRQTLTSSYRFGDTEYAKEELRAELTSVFLAAERGIPHDTSRHAAYVGSWIQTLKSDKNEIFRAAKDANRAADFLLVLEREQSVQKALETVRTQPQRDSSDLNQAGEKDRPSRKGTAALDPSFAEAKALSAQVLGEKVRVFNAQTGSGIYRGEIIGQTADHVVQKLSPDSTVAHIKKLLGSAPGKGESVTIRYSHGAVVDIAPFQAKARARELAR